MATFEEIMTRREPTEPERLHVENLLITAVAETNAGTIDHVKILARNALLEGLWLLDVRAELIRMVDNLEQSLRFEKQTCHWCGAIHKRGQNTLCPLTIAEARVAELEENAVILSNGMVREAAENEELKERVAELEVDGGAAAWVLEWLTADKHGKPEATEIILTARKQFKQLQEERNAARLQVAELESLVVAANDLSQFIASHEYPAPMSDEFHELTDLADKQDTIVRKILGIKSRAAIKGEK